MRLPPCLCFVATSVQGGAPLLDLVILQKNGRCGRQVCSWLVASGWCSVLSGTIQGPKSWLVQRLRPPNPSPAPNIVLNRYQMCWQHCTKPGTPSRPILVPRRAQFRYPVATNSGTPSRPIPVPILDQFWYQFWTNFGTSFGPNLVPVLDQFWYQFWTKSGSKSDPNLVQNRYQIWSRVDKVVVQMARTCIQNGPHLQHFLTGFARTKTGTCPAGPQNVRFTLDLRPQNGSHLETRKTINSKWRALAFKTGHICSSKWCTLAFQSGRAFHSRWAASPQGGPQASLKAGRRHPSRSAASPHESVPQASLKVADNLSPSSAEALPPQVGATWGPEPRCTQIGI